jgi:hypothetical protein
MADDFAFATASCAQMAHIVVHFLQAMFDAPARRNTAVPSDQRVLTAFHGVREPAVSIGSFCLTMMKSEIGCSAEVLVLAMRHLVLLDTRKALPLDLLTIHRLLLAALVCSAKYHEDPPRRVHMNRNWALLGGISAREMGELEREFLALMQYNVFVPTSEFLNVQRAMCAATVRHEMQTLYPQPSLLLDIPDLHDTASLTEASARLLGNDGDEPDDDVEMEPASDALVVRSAPR